jgi:hypothetical protein
MFTTNMPQALTLSLSSKSALKTLNTNIIADLAFFLIHSILGLKFKSKYCQKNII